MLLAVLFHADQPCGLLGSGHAVGGLRRPVLLEVGPFAAVLGLDVVFEEFAEGVAGEVGVLGEYDFVDLVLSHGLLDHAEEEGDGAGTVEEVVAVETAAEVVGQELDGVDHGAAQREHPQLAQVHDRYPGLHLSLQQAVLHHELEKIPDNLVECFFLQIRLDNAGDVDHDHRAVLAVAASQVEEPFLLSKLTSTSKA